jgi:hypothetical protein
VDDTIPVQISLSTQKPLRRKILAEWYYKITLSFSPDVLMKVIMRIFFTDQVIPYPGLLALHSAVYLSPGALIQ